MLATADLISVALKKGFKVVAVEADPKLAAALQKRFKTSSDLGQPIVVEAAVEEKEGEVQFFRNEDSTVGGTIHHEWAERNEKMGTRSTKVSVKAVRFQDLLKKHAVPHYRAGELAPAVRAFE